jgi:hypothetical protein
LLCGEERLHSSTITLLTVLQSCSPPTALQAFEVGLAMAELRRRRVSTLRKVSSLSLSTVKLDPSCTCVSKNAAQLKPRGDTGREGRQARKASIERWRRFLPVRRSASSTRTVMRGVETSHPKLTMDRPKKTDPQAVTPRASKNFLCAESAKSAANPSAPL